MSAPAFTLRLRDIDGEQIGIAAWVALACSGWAMYQARLIAVVNQNGGITPSRQRRLAMAHEAFTLVIEHMPKTNPFHDELRRYYDEVVVHAIGEEGDEIPKLLN